MKAPTIFLAFTLLKATMTQHLYVGSTLARDTWGFNSSTVQEVSSLIPCSYPILSSKLPRLWGNLSFMLQIRYYSLNARSSCFCWMPAMHWLVGTGFTAMPCVWLRWMSHCCRVETPVLRNNSWQQRDSSKPYLAVSVLRRNRMARKRSWTNPFLYCYSFFGECVTAKQKPYNSLGQLCILLRALKDLFPISIQIS